MRETEHKIDAIFTNRWSPRAMSGDALSDDELMPLFEAAKWAPSCFNNQHWRFVYARKGTKFWDGFFGLLMDANKTWCKDAAVLVLILSKKTFDHNNEPAITHSFDTGAAWENLALQGSINGLVVHGIAGFDYDKARELLDLSEAYAVEAMCVVGKPGNKDNLSEQLQQREVPSDRKKIAEIVFEGEFNE